MPGCKALCGLSSLASLLTLLSVAFAESHLTSARLVMLLEISALAKLLPTVFALKRL